MTWTKPYLGVQHLRESIKTGVIAQITVEDRGAFSEVYAIRRGTFDDFWRAEFCTANEAREAGEAFLRKMAV